MRLLAPIVAVAILIIVPLVGVSVGLEGFFGIVVPYVAILVFVVGFSLKVLGWGRVPVPFRIPTTCGQQKSLPWIKHSSIENPTTTGGLLIRMFLEVFLFRSLFRNTKVDYSTEGPRITYTSNQVLWLAGLAFHYSFLVITLRHLRFFMAQVPLPIQMIEGLDGFLQIGAPLMYITDLVIIGAVSYLFIRRVVFPQVKYISLAADYFPLLLILSIATTGVMMRYFTKVHIVGVKQLTMGLVSLSPVIPEGVGAIFYVHLFLISVLLMYFPLSKLMHMGGVFLSPTRNMLSNNRTVRHINPWNYDVKVHTYAAYEDDFRDKMKSVNLPLEKEPEETEEKDGDS